MGVVKTWPAEYDRKLAGLRKRIRKEPRVTRRKECDGVIRVRTRKGNYYTYRFEVDDGFRRR